MNQRTHQNDRHDRFIERIELNIEPIPKDRISACRRLAEDSRVPHEIRQLAELIVDVAITINATLGAFEFGCPIITAEPSERPTIDPFIP